MLLVPVEGQWSRIGRASYRRRIQRFAGEITFRPFPADANVYVAQELEIKKATEPVPIDRPAARN